MKSKSPFSSLPPTLLCLRLVGLIFSVLSFSVLCATASAAQPRSANVKSVALGFSSTGDLEIRSLPNVLAHQLIAPKLTTGLTTSFYLRVTYGSREEIVGGAEIRLRYDLWEESFLLNLQDGLGGRDRETVAEDRLATWWSNRRVTLGSASRLPVGTAAPLELQVQLTVLPYSSGELADTKRWLSKTGAAGRRNRPEPGNSAQRSNHLFNLLLGTSLERKTLYSQTWTVRLKRPSSESEDE